MIKFKIPGEEKEKAVSFGNIEAILDAAGNNRAPELLKEYYRPSKSAAPAAPPVSTAPTDTMPAQSPPPAAAVDSLLPKTPGLSVTPLDTILSPSPPSTAAPVNRLQPAPKTAKPPDVWNAEEDRVYREGRRRLWGGAFCAFGDFSIPLGDWYTDVNAGLGFEADFLVCVSRNIALRAHISRSGLNVDDFFYDVDLSDPEFELVDEESKLSVSRYMLMVQYNEPALDKTVEKVCPYAVIGLGMVRETGSGNATVRYTPTGEMARSVFDRTDDHFAMTTGLGLVWKVGKYVGIDLELTNDMIFISAQNVYGEPATTTAYIIDFKLGLLYLF